MEERMKPVKPPEYDRFKFYKERVDAQPRWEPEVL